MIKSSFLPGLALLASSFLASVSSASSWNARDADLSPFYKDSAASELVLNYHYSPGSNSISESAEIKAVEYALNVWAQSSSIRFVKASNADSAQITFSWPTSVLDYVDGELVEPGGAYGLSRARGVIVKQENGGPLLTYKRKAEIFFDKTDLKSAAALTANAIHEIGHAIGFSHTDDADDIMYDTFIGGGFQAYLSLFDLNILLAQYGDSPQIASLPLQLDFEGKYDWPNTGDVNWLLNSGHTGSTGTGPVRARQGQRYAYIETSSSAAIGSHDLSTAYAPNTEASIESPMFNPSKAKMTFHYNMYGSKIGSLYVDVFSGGKWKLGVWQKHGQQGSSGSAAGLDWRVATISLGAYSSPAKVRVRAVSKGGWAGDTAIDELAITKACSPSVINIGQSCNNGWCQESFGRSCSSAGGTTIVEQGQFICVAKSNTCN